MKRLRDVRFIFFDAGNTLLHIDYPFIAALEVCREAGITEQALMESETRARIEAGKRFARGDDDREVVIAYFHDILSGAGLADVHIEEAGRHLRRKHKVEGLWTHVLDGTHELLAELAGRGYRMAIISNADGRVEAYLDELGLTEHMDFVLDSAVVGAQKPDPKIFRLAMERAGATPEQSLYIGDIPAVDVDGAAAVGMLPVLVDPLDFFGELDCLRVKRVHDLPELLEEA